MDKRNLTYSDTREFIAVGLGEVLWDLFLDGEKKFGGAPTNFACLAHCLGAKSFLVSSIGNDDLGKEAFQYIDKLKLNRKFVSVDKDHPTGTVTVKLDDFGQPDYVIHENAAWDFIPSNPDLLKFASEVDIVCFGSLCQRSKISAETVREFLKTTKPQCIRLFDINIRQSYYSQEIIKSMLELANIFKLNDEEMSLVAGIFNITGSETDILNEILKRFQLDLIILTKGANGSLLIKEGQESYMPVKPIEIVDTVGAGDAFAAAVAMGLLHKSPLRAIHEHANRLAAFVCTQTGAIPNIPDELIMM
jgi:fructokinase